MGISEDLLLLWPAFVDVDHEAKREPKTTVPRTRVKICGITRPQDAAAAVAAGADAIGLVFYEPSPRAVTVAQAREICREAGSFVTVVALTVNADNDLLSRIVNELPVGLLQFHGDELPETCQRWQRPYLKAVRMRDGVILQEQLSRYGDSRGLLLDAYKKGVPGGTGECFDWQAIDPALGSRIVLAGGLDAGNVKDAITTVKPFAVDVSGGVEDKPGIKAPEKIKQFMAAVQQADEALRL